jgi:hypothetical protein
MVSRFFACELTFCLARSRDGILEQESRHSPPIFQAALPILSMSLNLFTIIKSIVIFTRVYESTDQIIVFDVLVRRLIGPDSIGMMNIGRLVQ